MPNELFRNVIINMKQGVCVVCDCIASFCSAWIAVSVRNNLDSHRRKESIFNNTAI